MEATDFAQIIYELLADGNPEGDELGIVIAGARIVASHCDGGQFEVSVRTKEEELAGLSANTRERRDIEDARLRIPAIKEDWPAVGQLMERLVQSLERLIRADLAIDEWGYGPGSTVMSTEAQAAYGERATILDAYRGVLSQK